MLRTLQWFNDQEVVKKLICYIHPDADPEVCIMYIHISVCVYVCICMYVHACTHAHIHSHGSSTL